MSPVVATAEATVRELARRRVAVVLLVAVPLAFYCARHDRTGQSVRFLGIGLGWAVSTFAAFAGASGRRVDEQLRIAGHRPWQLLAGRAAALLAVGGVLVAAFSVLVALDQPVRRPWAVVLGQALTVVVAVPLGLLLAALLRRELEASLLLIAVVGIQFVLDPVQGAARLLPFWSTRELITYAVDPTGSEHLVRGVVHGLVTATVCAAAAAALTGVRLRPAGHLVRLPGPVPPSGRP